MINKHTHPKKLEEILKKIKDNEDDFKTGKTKRPYPFTKEEIELSTLAGREIVRRNNLRLYRIKNCHPSKTLFHIKPYDRLRFFGCIGGLNFKKVKVNGTVK